MKKYKKTYIEITNVCNLACDFCPKTKRPAQFMSRELFENILRKIKDHSEYLYFHVMGEPLLHPEIGYFLELCQQYGYRVNITTNGTLIDRAGDSIISKPALRQVNFSLHSFEANKSVNSMEDYLDKIFKFIRKSKDKQENKLLICLRLWNIAEEGLNKKNRFILQQIGKEFGLDTAIEESITHCKGIKLDENVFLNQAAVFVWPDNELAEIGCRGFCYGLRDQVAILADGTVIPCCLDREGVINLGNIQEQDFEDIMSGERAHALYEGFSRRDVVEPLCRKCGYRTRFGV